MLASRPVATSIRTLRLALVGALVAVVACSGTADVAFDDGGGGAGAGAGAGASSSGGAGTGGSGTGGLDPSCLCGAASFPVCGEDGNTYDAACGYGCVPVAVACDGACPCLSCDAIASAYRQKLEEAKACDAAIDFEQCTELLPGGLPCGCNTFVNPSTDAYPTLLELLAKWQDRDCGADVQCEACDEDPVAGACTSDSGNARIDTCADVRAND